MEVFSNEREEMISKINDRLFNLTNDQLSDVVSYLSILGCSDSDDDSQEYSSESSYEEDLDIDSKEYQDLLKKLSSVKLPPVN